MRKNEKRTRGSGGAEKPRKRASCAEAAFYVRGRETRTASQEKKNIKTTLTQTGGEQNKNKVIPRPCQYRSGAFVHTLTCTIERKRA